MIYFNFHEIQLICEDQIPAIFVLTASLGLDYTRYRYRSLNHFKETCFGVKDVPRILYTKRAIVKETGKIVLKYRTKYPQSYISNISFSVLPFTVTHKVQYIKLLSYREIGNKSNWIPTDYIEDLSEISNNPLLQIQQDKIHFKYEGIYR